jgi:hypothetical protein
MTARGLIGETVQGGAPYDRPAGCDRWIILSLAAADRAKPLGLLGVSICASGMRASVSRTVYFRDCHARSWKVRISDHALPDRSRRCHFNLVTRDGVFGREQLLGFIDRVAAGQVEWFDVVGTEKKLRPRLKARIRKHY